MGSARVVAQFLRMRPGSRSGPVALEGSIELRRLRVHLVRSRVNVVCLAGAETEGVSNERVSF